MVPSCSSILTVELILSEAVKIAEAVDTSERLLLLDKRIDNNFGYFGRGCLLPKSDHWYTSKGADPRL